jgi:hypothetical protein
LTCFGFKEKIASQEFKHLGARSCEKRRESH